MRIARIATTLLILVVFVGTFFGRPLTNRYKELVEILPLIAYGLCLSLFLGISIFLHQKHIAKFKLLPQRAVAILLSSILLLVVLFLSAKYSVELPIERVHFIKYALLGFLIFFSFKEPRTIKTTFRSFVCASGIGILEESLQIFVPNRYFDERDILSNVLAALIGCLIAHINAQWPKALTKMHQKNAAQDPS